MSEQQPDDGATDEVAPTTNVRSWLVAGGVAAVLAVGAGYVLGSGGGDDTTTEAAAAVASEDQASGDVPVGPGGAQFGPGAGGTIASVDGDTLTVEGEDGSTTTVRVGDDTVVRETVDGSVDDLAEGDSVLVLGEADDDGNVTAATVVDNGDTELALGGGGGFPGGGTPPEGGDFTPPDGATRPDGGFGGGGLPTSGQVTAVDGDTLTVETADGESVTVTLTDDTTVSVTQELSVDDLEAGDTVRVQGEAGDDDVLVASVIQVGDAAFGGLGGPPAGGA